ncbi:hypothetical protein OIU77_022368 [Salix suchowensis]|uniref:Annexin n=1 Tax=Salix suchowensis TaxID=1278906 RepID=A0ABQ9C024_9ROSI|nr:hypothetical protein OIU77_022368 [Salix suchowensis]
MIILQLLVGLMTAFRYEGDEINARLADSEADILHDAIKDKEYNHEDFIRILTTRSRTQLMATFKRYRDDHGNSITRIHNEPAEEFKTILRTAIRCIYNHKKFYEKILRNSIRKFGTDEDALTRVIVTRAEKDLNDIKELTSARKGGLNFVLLLAFQCFQSQFNSDLCSTFFL